MRTLLLAAVLLLPGASQAGPPFPGGLLDSTGRTAFVTTPGGIEALDLTRGDVLWRTDRASQPLFVAGDRLYALALGLENQLFVCGFDLNATGRKVFESAAIELPRWATASTRPRHSFSYRWQRRQNRLEVTWQASAGTEGGPRKEAAGLVWVDLESGKVRQQSTPLAPAPATPRVPPQLEKLAVRWQRVVGGQLFALVVEELPGSGPGQRRQRLVLLSWNERTGKENPPRELMRGRRLVLMPGLDDRHLWLRDGAPGSGEPFAGRHWSVFAAIDGHLVARVPFVPGTRSATIIGDWAYCLSAGAVRATPEGAIRGGRVLHAIDLRTGKVAWRRPGLAPSAVQGSRHKAD